MKCPTCGHDPTPQPPVQGKQSTSKAAAAHIAPHVATQQHKILNYLCAVRLGAIDEEMQTYLHMSPNAQRPRRGELVELGLVKDTGRTRANDNGLDCMVWAATLKGSLALNNPGTEL